MRSTRYTKSTSALLAIMHLIFSVMLVISGQVHAQTLDVDPPSIDLELVEEGVRGETQVFSATVNDNDQISSMTLHYRFGSDSAYVSAPMSVIAGTDIYTTSIDTNGSTADVIQYYMEARDAGGNRTVQGFAFDPFERSLVDEDAPVVSDATTVVPAVEPVVAAKPRLSTGRKVAYGLIGLLVVGGLASALGGGGSGGGGDSPSTGDVDLNIVVEPF